MQLKIQQLQEKIKMVSTPLSVKVGNASKAFTASILRGPNSLLNHLFKASSPFGDSEAAESPAPKAPVIESATTETAIGRAVSISTTVIPCSQNKVQILSVKDVSLSTITVCMILATYIWRFSQLCDSISILSCGSAFKFFSLPLYSFLCYSE